MGDEIAYYRSIQIPFLATGIPFSPSCSFNLPKVIFHRKSKGNKHVVIFVNITVASEAVGKDFRVKKVQQCLSLPSCPFSSHRHSSYITSYHLTLVQLCGISPFFLQCWHLKKFELIDNVQTKVTLSKELSYYLL